MATSIPSGSPHVFPKESAGITAEAELKTFLTLLTGEDDDNAFVVEKRSGGSQRGDELTLRYQEIRDDQDWFGPYSNVIGHEYSTEPFTEKIRQEWFEFPMAIENLRHDQAMVEYNVKKMHLRKMAGVPRLRREKWVISQMAGDLVAKAAGGSQGCVFEYAGGNDITSHSNVGVDPGHLILAKGLATEALVAADSTAIFTTDLITEATTRAASRNYTGQEWTFSPCKTPWGDLYVCVVSPKQWQDLRKWSSTNEFTEIEKAKIQGGMDPSSSFYFRGPAAIWDRTLILVHDMIPKGIASSGTAYEANTARAIFFGAQAGSWLYGDGFSHSESLAYTEFVAHHRWSAMISTFCGFKVREPAPTIGGTPQRWASFVISTRG